MLHRPIELAQYTSGQFRTALAEHRIRPSVGRVGSCYDNAVAEAFFATLKTEIGVSIWPTRSEARQDIFTYLRYYNHCECWGWLVWDWPTRVGGGRPGSRS
ncbi:integrase core domain-containing protein [Amycolatopsis vastitatis]|uniref:Integrase catalytic domain-containing protein n=1 Tax=Amycolatopsis vastitatis TaxID=1905142 RepID=A0A229SRA3_9PSEU|nr:integrase core domain-containing protein [Amycolatopsis vastitatis]OXM61353.1 hypothetical protein CF165_38390 [Amycolatopsis vastitatis]